FLGKPIFADTNSSMQAPDVKMFNGSNFFIKKFPDIKGTVDVRNLMKAAAKVDFIDAAGAAKSAVSSGTVPDGSLGIQQGYLVYNFEVMDADNLVHNVIVDAGSGSVLYTSDGFDMGPNVPSITDGGPQVFASMKGMVGVGGISVEKIR